MCEYRIRILVMELEDKLYDAMKCEKKYKEDCLKLEKQYEASSRNTKRCVKR